LIVADASALLELLLGTTRAERVGARALAAGESQEIRSRMKSVETLIKKLDATMKRMKQPAIPSP